MGIATGSLRTVFTVALMCWAAWIAASPALARTQAQASAESIAVTELPPEARETLRSIKRGGPYRYERDGVVFGNYEKRLPLKQHGYYREYTVPTPGARDRGARRIVAGRGGELYYTDDHYRSFRRIRE